ncbi:MAG: VIT1/CCC1 transporter family protein [bacterium]|nr:VIT1/CCC1 transporter family protein [bacterium]
MANKNNLKAICMRSFVMGSEDSLVSTVGLLSGIATAGVSRPTILLTGAILLSVEAFSMAVGSFLSERSAEEYAVHHEVSPKYSFIGSAVMLCTYLIAGFIPLSPYIFAGEDALIFSILFSLVTLFVVGIITAKVVNVNILWNGFRTLLIGGIAILVGVFIGGLVSI